LKQIRKTEPTRTPIKNYWYN